VEDYVENGPRTQVKSLPIAHHSPALMKSIISFLNLITNKRRRDGRRAAKTLRNKQNQGAMNYSIRRRRVTGSLRGMCLMKCRRSHVHTYTHTHTHTHTHTQGCRDIEPEASDASHGCLRSRMHQSARGGARCVFVHLFACLTRECSRTCCNQPASTMLYIYIYIIYI